MKYLLSYVMLFLSSVLLAQGKDRHIPAGNEAYSQKQYAEAEANYRISQSKAPGNSAASYNLGNSIYSQNQPAEAANAYRKALKDAKTRTEKHKAFHNLGNTFMKEKNYSAAVEAYKNALRNDPSDDQTRYNYALAKKYLKENPPKDENKKDQKDDKKKQDNKDEKDKQDKNKDKDKQDKENDKNGDKDPDKKQQDQQPKPKPKPGDMSRQRIENLLDAVNNEEKKIQDKVKARQQQGKPVKTEKDW